MFDFFEDLFDWGSDAVSTSFTWLSENPEVAAGLVKGVGQGAFSYLASAEKGKAAKELEQLRQRRTDNRHYAQYGSPDEYIGTLTADGGPLTKGILAKQMGR